MISELRKFQTYDTLVSQGFRNSEVLLYIYMDTNPITLPCSLARAGNNVLYFITPHAQRERGKVIDRGVHIYMSVVEKKI